MGFLYPQTLGSLSESCRPDPVCFVSISPGLNSKSFGFVFVLFFQILALIKTTQTVQQSASVQECQKAGFPRHGYTIPIFFPLSSGADWNCDRNAQAGGKSTWIRIQELESGLLHM